MGIAAIHRHLARVVDASPGFGAVVRHPRLHRPLVVIDGAIAINQMTHVMQGPEAPIDATEVGEKAGVDRPAAEVEFEPAPFGLQAAGGGIHDRKARAALAPGGVELLLLGAELAVGVEGAPQRAQFQLGQVAKALVDGAAPAQAAGELHGAAAAGIAPAALSAAGQEPSQTLQALAR